MKKVLLKLFIAVFVIPVSVAGVLHFLNQQGFFNLQTIEVVVVNGDAQKKFVEPLKLNLEQNLKIFANISLWSLELNEVAKVLAKEKWIERHQVSRRWPATMRVEVQAFEVQLLFLAKDGSMLPVVEDGSYLPATLAQTAPDVAILHGQIFEKNPEMRKKAVSILKQIPLEGKFSAKSIAEVQYDNKEGFWATLVQSGIKVKMGEDHINLKSQRVAQVLEYLERRQLEARVIDADLSKKVLVRLRKGP